MPRFDSDANKLVGKQPVRVRKERKINRSTSGTTTYGAHYSHLAMCTDSYNAVVGQLKAEWKVCQTMRTFGVKHGVVDMVNANDNELSLIGCLLDCAKKWYRRETKYCQHKEDLA